MILREHANAADFLASASAFLEEREAENCVILGLAGRLAAEPAPEPAQVLATLEDGGQVVAAAMRTPGQKLILTRAPALAIAILADHLARRRCELPGVVGPVESANLFITAWRKLSRQAITPGRSMRVLQLERVILPSPPAGCFAEAGAADAPMLAGWVRAFHAEVHEPALPDAAGLVQRALAERRLVVWKDPAPVCMASFTGPTPRGVRINLVYTPPERRRQGYATATVAALSQSLLGAGRRYCFLFTDLANPTSNSIYRRIGYQPVAEYKEHLFDDRPAGG